MGSKDKKEAIYDFVVEFKEKNDGNSPSYEEIMEGCKIASPSMVNYYLDKLEIDGRIKRDGVKSIVVIGGKWSKE